MKIAVPVKQNGQIDDHFGHCDYYAIFEIDGDGKVFNHLYIKSENGCGCKSGIASTLAGQGVEVMLAGGIGSGAVNVLHQAGISVIRGCSGDSSEAVKHYVTGNLIDNGEVCQHHEHHHGHGHHDHGSS
jgi:predicted Fe-Mo cluster-binding NifX family protein